MISFISSTEQLIFSTVDVLSSPRLKDQPADLPDGGEKKHTDAHVAPHHCEMKTSRLPTLPEEETSDLKSPEPVPMVREEADGKDDAVEVSIHNTDVHINSDMLFKSQTNHLSPSSSSCRAW